MDTKSNTANYRWEFQLSILNKGSRMGNVYHCEVVRSLTAWSIVLCPWYHSVSWSRSVRYCISSPFITRHLTPPSIIFTFLNFFSDRLSTGNWTFRPLAVSPAAWTVRPLNDSPPGRFAPYMWTFRPKLTVLGISPSRRGRIQIDVLPHLRMFPSSRNGTY